MTAASSARGREIPAASLSKALRAVRKSGPESSHPNHGPAQTIVPRSAPRTRSGGLHRPTPVRRSQHWMERSIGQPGHAVGTRKALGVGRKLERCFLNEMPELRNSGSFHGDAFGCAGLGAVELSSRACNLPQARRPRHWRGVQAFKRLQRLLVPVQVSCGLAHCAPVPGLIEVGFISLASLNQVRPSSAFGRC